METLVTSLTSGFTSIVSDMMGAIGSIVPVALPVVGAIAVVGIGIRLFRSMA